MDRLACVSVPYLALQIALKRHPQWKDLPVAIVDEHKPLGFVLEVNRQARQFRIKPGMRYSAALSLTEKLRAAVIEDDDIEEHEELLESLLHNFSPSFERHEKRGTFWVCATGLDRLFGSFDTWSEQLFEEFKSYGFYASVVVGFSRFGTYALARNQRAGIRVLASEDEERQRVDRTPIAALGVDPKFRDALEKLAITTVGELRGLPSGGVRERYGEEAQKLLDSIHGTQVVLPLQPEGLNEPVQCRVELMDAECDSNRLLFLIKEKLHPMLLELTARHCDLLELVMQLILEDGDCHEHTIKPATPTLDEKKVIDLARLRLENLLFPSSGVIAIVLIARGVPIRREQEALFAGSMRRDMQAANHALARLKAEFGDHCVLKVQPCDAHVPEQKFELVPLETIRRAEPEKQPQKRNLIRRIRNRPEPLHRFRNDPLEGWLLHGLEAGPVNASWGPFTTSGQWWTPDRIDRDYYFARTREGDIFWVFYDHIREQWFLHGVVE